MSSELDAAPSAPAGGDEALPLAQATEQGQPSAQPSTPAASTNESDAPVHVDVPADILAERSADHARRMYDPQKTYWSALRDLDQPVEGLDPKIAKAVRVEAAEMMADATMSAAEAESFATTLRRWSRNPPSDEQRQSWRVDAAQRLHELYGKDAQRELNRATAWLKRDPRRVKLMEHNGLGDHPSLILLAVEIARRARQRVAR